MITLKHIIAVSALCLTSACQQTPVYQAPPIPVIATDVNNSQEVPTCSQAAERVKQYMELGVWKDDIRRLVGKPLVETPNSYRWSEQSTTGTPYVNHSGGRVTSYSAAANLCHKSGNE